MTDAVLRVFRSCNGAFLNVGDQFGALTVHGYTTKAGTTVASPQACIHPSTQAFAAAPADSCDICATALAPVYSGGKSSSKQGNKSLLKVIEFTWAGASGTSILSLSSGVSVSVSSLSDGDTVLVAGISKKGSGKVLPGQLKLSVGSWQVLGQSTYGYDTRCGPAMAVGDMIQAPAGVLTVTGFKTSSQQTEKNCLAAVDVAQFVSGAPAGCSICATGGVGQLGAGVSTGKSGTSKRGKGGWGKAALKTIHFEWTGTSNPTIVASMPLCRATSFLPCFASVPGTDSP